MLADALIPVDLLDRIIGLVFLAILFSWLDAKQAVMKAKKKRLIFFDLVKGISILGVVAIHAAGVAHAGEFLNRIIWVCLPLFVIASGYLLAWRHKYPIDLAEYARGTFMRLLLPYTLFTILAAVLQTRSADIGSIALDLLFGRQNGYTLFFIPLLIQLYILFPILLKYRRVVLQPAALGLLFLLSYSLSDWDHSLRADTWSSNLLSLVFCGRYLFYFAFGMWLSKWDLEKERLKNNVRLLLIGLPMLALAFTPSGWDQPFIYPIWALLLLQEIYQRVKENWFGKIASAVFASLGHYSLMIYMLHTIVIYELLKPLQGQFALEGFSEYALITIVAATISWALGKVVWDTYNGVRKIMA